jgi:hypothetical protein
MVFWNERTALQGAPAVRLVSASLVTCRPVSKAVNSVKNNRPELLELI